MEVSEGHHHEEIIDNENYELMNVDMEILESLHCMSRGKQMPHMKMFQASDLLTKWGHLVMRRLIAKCHINSVEDSRSWRRCQRSLSAE